MKKTVLKVCLTVFLLGAGTPLRCRAAEPIPADLLPDKYRENFRQVTGKPSLYREMEGVEFEGTEKTYNFLLNHLPLTAALIRALKLQNYHIERNPDGSFVGNDGAGAKGKFHLVYAESRKRVYYGVGEYKAGFLKVTGEAVLVVQFQETPGNKVLSTVGLYVKFKNVLISSVIKAFSRILARLVQRKITSILNTAKLLFREMSQPGTLLEKLPDLKGLSPPDRTALREFLS